MLGGKPSIYLFTNYLQLLSSKKIAGENVGEWYNQAATNCKKKDKRKKKPWVNSTTKHPRIAIKIEEGKMWVNSTTKQPQIARRTILVAQKYLLILPINL